MVRRPTILELAPRVFRITDTRFEPVGTDVRSVGLALIVISVGLLVFLDLNLSVDPTMPSASILLGILGLVIVRKAPLARRRTTLLDLNLSQGVFSAPVKTTNGSGASIVEYGVDDVDELLFAMRDAPMYPDNPKSITVHAFALYIRVFDGDLIPVVEACVDKDRTFKVATFLAEAFDVGIKQVGKGWRSD